MVLAVLAMTLFASETFAATPISSCGYAITAPGSYTLTADLTCPGVGIFVTASSVDLDLNHHFIANSSSNDVGIITAAQDPFTPGRSTLDFSSCLTVTGVHIHGGTVTHFNQGVVVCSNNAATKGPSLIMGVQIDHMVITSNHVGLAILSSGGNTVDSNFLSSNDTYALQLDNAATNLIGKNLIDSNSIGMTLDNNSNLNTLLVNTVTLSYFVGVRLTGSKDNLISNNFFTDSNNGSTAVAIDLFAGTSGNRVTGNIAFYSVVTDMLDFLPCNTNIWTNNFFGSSIGFCIH